MGRGFHDLISKVRKEKVESSTKCIGILNERERMIDLMNNSALDRETEEPLSSAEKRRVRGGIFTFADARALLREEEKKGNMRGRDLSTGTARDRKEDDDRERQRVAHRLNYRESYASPIIEKESSQDIREKNQRINDVKMGKETRRRREDINSYLQDSSHLDDMTTLYEVDGFEMPKNRNGMIKEKESERGRDRKSVV